MDRFFEKETMSKLELCQNSFFMLLVYGHLGLAVILY